MSIDDLRKYQEMQFDGTLERFNQREFERRQILVQQANTMREFARRAEMLGYGMRP